MQGIDDGELERRLFTPPTFDEKPARFVALLVPAAEFLLQNLHAVMNELARSFARVGGEGGGLSLQP